MKQIFFRIIFLIFWLPVFGSIPAHSASLKLLDSKLNEVVAYFSSLTDNTYILEFETQKTFSISRENLNGNEEIHSLLVELVEGAGGTVSKLADRSYKISSKTITAPMKPEEPKPKRLLKRVMLNDKISFSGLKTLIKSDEGLQELQVIEESLDSKSVLLLGDSVNLVFLKDLLTQLPYQTPVTEKTSSETEINEADNIIKNDLPKTATIVIDLNYADAKEIVENLQTILAGETKDINVAPHPSANQIIASGDRWEVENISTIIKQLDRAPRQVYVDVIIAEVSEETAAKLGLQFSVNSDNLAASVVTGVSGVNIGAAAGDPFLAGATGGIFAAGRGANVVPDIGLMLTALQGDTDNRILATPSLMATENKESIILVGQNVPFITGQYTNQGGDNTAPFQTIKREDLGTLLKLKPKIGINKNIVMEIWQEESRIDRSAPGLSDVVTVKRQISTVISANEGETVALGGLKVEQQEVGITKVPFLGDLPVIGSAFRQEVTNSVSRNLAIFLRPTLVNTKKDRKKIYNTWQKTLGTELYKSPTEKSNYFDVDAIGKRLPSAIKEPASAASQNND